MEYVDIVDEKGNKLFVESKTTAHEKGLLHKTVIAQLINSNAERLLIRPPSHKQDRGQYVSPVGGHVTAGELEVDALKREVLEEIGIHEFAYKHIGSAIYDRHVLGRHENHLFILYEIYTDETPILGDEAEYMRWFTWSELKREIYNKPKDFGDAFYFVAKAFYPKLLQVED